MKTTEKIGSFIKFSNGLTIEGDEKIWVEVINGAVNIKSDKGLSMEMSYERWMKLQTPK